MRTRPRPFSAEEPEQAPLLLASCWDWESGSARDEEDGDAAAPEHEEEQDEEEGEGPEPLCFAPAPQPPPCTTEQEEATLQEAQPGVMAAPGKGRGFAAACIGPVGWGSKVGKWQQGGKVARAGEVVVTGGRRHHRFWPPTDKQKAKPRCLLSTSHRNASTRSLPPPSPSYLHKDRTPFDSVRWLFCLCSKRGTSIVQQPPSPSPSPHNS